MYFCLFRSANTCTYTSEHNPVSIRYTLRYGGWKVPNIQINYVCMYMYIFPYVHFSLCSFFIMFIFHYVYSSLCSFFIMFMFPYVHFSLCSFFLMYIFCYVHFFHYVYVSLCTFFLMFIFHYVHFPLCSCYEKRHIGAVSARI